MRSALVWTTLAVLGGSAGADPIGRPWDLMDLAGGGNRVGMDLSFASLTGPGSGPSIDVFDLDLMGQFEVTPTIDLTARVPMATGEDDSVLGDVSIGVIGKLRESTTSSGGHLKMGIEGTLYLPTGSKPSTNNLKNFFGAGFSRTFLYPRWAGRELTIRGGFGIRYETGTAFFEGDLGLDMMNETEDRSRRNDNTHFFFHLGGSGGAEVARNLAVIGEFTYSKEVNDNNFDGPAIDITAGLRYRTGKLTLGGALLKSIDLPSRLSSFGFMFSLLAYF